jgi:hypothetical protein
MMTSATNFPLLLTPNLAAAAFSDSALARSTASGMMTSSAAWAVNDHFAAAASREPETLAPLFVPPVTVSARNIFQFPALLAQVEEIERECHRAKDVWTRGTLALCLLAESYRFGDYVSTEGLLTDAGRAFLESDTSALRKALMDRKIAEAMAQPHSAPVPAKAPPPPPAPSAPTALEEANFELARWRRLLDTAGPEILAEQVTDTKTFAMLARLTGDRNHEVSVLADHVLSEALIRHPELIPSVRRIAADLDPTAASALTQAAVEAARSAIRQPAFAVESYVFLLEEMSAPSDDRTTALSDTSSAYWKATMIIGMNRMVRAQRQVFLQALETAAVHPSPLVRKTAEALIYGLTESVTLEMERSLFVPPRETGSFYDYAIRGVDFENGPRKLADMLTDSPWLVRFAAVLLGKHERDTKKGTAMALALVADRLDITPALPMLGMLQYWTPARPLNPDALRRFRAQMKATLEAAARNPATRELAEKLLATRYSSEVNAILKPPVPHDEALPKQDPAVAAPSKKKIDELVSTLNSWDKKERENAAAFLRHIFAQGNPAAAYAAETLLQTFPKLSRANKKTAADLLATASKGVNVPSEAFFHELLLMLKENSIEEPISRAFANWAAQPASRQRVLTAIANGIGLDDLVFRGKVLAVMGRLVASTNTHQHAMATIQSWSTDRKDPHRRASAALALGMAYKQGHSPSRLEGEILNQLSRDSDRDVQSKADWALMARRGV